MKSENKKPFIQSALGETAKKVVASKVNAWFNQIDVTIKLPKGGEILQ
jgi:hypothetical protein